MNKRDRDILQALLLRLTAWFSDPTRHADPRGLTRGQARVIVAAIRELNRHRDHPPDHRSGK